MPARNSAVATQSLQSTPKCSQSPSPFLWTSQDLQHLIVAALWFYSLTYFFLYCKERAQRIKCQISCHFSAQSARSNNRDFFLCSWFRLLCWNYTGFILAKHWQSSVQVQLGGGVTRDSLHAWCGGVQESFDGSGV